MRILTGFIPMTSGEAKIDNLDVFEESLKVREIIGYLPETNLLFFWERSALARAEKYCQEILRKRCNSFLQILTLWVSLKNQVTPGF